MTSDMYTDQGFTGGSPEMASSSYWIQKNATTAIYAETEASLVDLTEDTHLFSTGSDLEYAYGSDMAGVTVDPPYHVVTEKWIYSTQLLNLTNGSFGNITDEMASYKEFYDTAQFVTGLICMPIMCLYGLTGNVLILIVFAQKSMHTSTNVYLSALAVSDMIKLINDCLYFLTILLFHTDPNAGNKAYGYLYPYAHFIFNMSTCVSSWLTVSVAVERYILVCHPTRSKTLITIPRAKIISITCFLFMTSIAIPSALRYRTVETVKLVNGQNITLLDVELTALWKNQQFVLAYNWLQNLLRSIIPLFVLVFMNAFIINALRKTRANKRNASRNKITIMLIIVIIFFLVCITPDAILSSFFNLGYTESENFLVRGVREITDCLLAVNSAMNFTLYIVFNKIFRDQFLALFCKRCIKPTTAEDAQYRRLSEAKPHSNGVAKSKTNTIQTSL